MQQKHNINALMAQYAKELGEDLDDIEPELNEENAFADDPEMMKLQKQLNLVSGNLNAKIGGQQQKKGDIYDDMLLQYEQPQKRPQQMQQQVQAPQQRAQPKQKQGPDLSVIEQQYTVPEELQSLRVLKQEIGFINSNILPNLKQNPALQAFYKNLVLQLQAKQQNLINEIKEEKLDAKAYQKLVQATFDKEQNKFKETADPKYKNRIGMRCKTMFEELGLLKDRKFEKICQEFNCGPDNSAKFLYEEFNTKPFKQKAKELFVRHKEWLNLTQYLTNYMKDEKNELIQFLISKLEKSKEIQISLKKGEDVDFAKFFILEFKELTEEQFLGMAKPEFQARVQNMIDQVNQANKEEQQYYKVASVAKPIISVIQGTKQMQKINPGDASKQHFARYEQFLKYLTELKDSKWTPLPVLRLDSEQREVSTVNKDVPQNVLRVQFKEITGGDKYYLTFEITLGGQQLQFKTEAANGDGKLNHVQDINLRDYRNAAKEVHQQEIIVKAFKKGWLSSDLKGQGKIYLNDLLDMSTYDGSVSLGNNKALIFCIQLRESINKKRTVSVAQMVKTYPKFNKDDGLEESVATKLAEIPDTPKVVKAPVVVNKKEEKIEEEVPQIQAPKLTADKLIALIHQDDDPEYQKVKAYAEANPQYKEDLLYPENPVNGGVFYFLQQYQPFIEKKIGEFRSIPQLKMQSRFAQKLFEECFRQNLRLKRQIENKEFEGYKKNLNIVIQKDQMLLKIYQKEQTPTWAKFIEARLEVAVKELESLSQMKIADAPKQAEQPKQEKAEQEGEIEEEDQAPKLTPDKLIALIHLEDDPEYQKVKAYAETVPNFKDELLYPENPVNGGVFYFLQQYTPFIEKKIGEFRSIPELKMQSRFAQKLFEDCCRQNVKLSGQLENDIEGYKVSLEKVIKKDEMFLKIYQKEQAPTWAKFIGARLEIAKQEQQALNQM